MSLRLAYLPRSLCLVLASLIISGCLGFPPKASQFGAYGKTVVLPPKISPVHTKSPILAIVPGLNSSEESLVPFMNNLSRRGFTTVIIPVELSEEGESSETLVENLSQGVAGIRSKYSDRDIVLFGYSLGALVAAEYVHRENPEFVSGLVLLAPAQGMKLRTQLMRPLAWLHWTGLGIRSFSPEKYRERLYTPLQTYNALYDLLSSQHEFQSEALQIRRGLVILIKGDELIDVPRTNSWIQRNNLSHWEIHELSADQRIESEASQHLIIHPDGVGEGVWQTVMSLSSEFLRRDHSAV